MTDLSTASTSAENTSGVLANQALAGQVSPPVRLHTSFVPVAVKDLSKLPADVQTRLLNSRFDASVHKLMNEAKNDTDWLTISVIGLNAIKIGNWRNAIKNRFMVEAPSHFVLQHKIALGIVPQPNPKAPSPLGNKTISAEERAKHEARLAARRLKRHAEQPVGVIGQEPPKHGKGKKKNKK